MGQQTGVDIAWDRPTVDAIKGAGATWVARYFSNDVTKNLTPSEVQAYTAAGLGIVVVWETTAARALQGFQAGVDDAKAARAQRASVGLPDSMPIHFATDTDADWAQVAAYYQGAVSVLGLDLVGSYGGLKVIEGAHAYGLRYLWQTVAWSGGLWAPYATIRQPGGTTLAGGADFDTAEVPDFGQYPRPSTPEVDVNLTDKMPAYAGIKQADGTTYVPTVGECINGAKQSDTKLDALAAAVAQLETKVAGIVAPQLTPEQVQALAAQLAPVLAPAILAAMGHKLDGTQ